MTRTTAISAKRKNATAKRKFVPPTEAEIAFCAYAIYAKENPDRAMSLWQEAEAQLIAARRHDAGLFPHPKSFSRN